MSIKAVVHLLQQHMARVVENVAARVIIHQRQKTLKRHPVVQVFPRMQLKADVYALFIEGIQNRPPAGCQRRERLLKTLLVMRRPRVEKRPGQRAGERCVRFQAQSGGGDRRLLQFRRGPRPAGRIVTAHGRGREMVKRVVVSRVNGHKLPFKMGRQLAYDKPVCGQLSGDVIAVGPLSAAFSTSKMCG